MNPARAWMTGGAPLRVQALLPAQAARAPHKPRLRLLLGRWVCALPMHYTDSAFERYYDVRGCLKWRRAPDQRAGRGDTPAEAYEAWLGQTLNGAALAECVFDRETGGYHEGPCIPHGTQCVPF